MKPLVNICSERTDLGLSKDPSQLLSRLVQTLALLIAPLTPAWANTPSPPEAMEAGQRDQLIALLAAGADVNTPQPDGTRAVHWAAYHEDASSLSLLLAKGADPDAANRYGVTPLSLACQNGDLASIQALIAAGANPNLSLPGGETPLMTAARTGHVGAVDLLLAAGAEVSAREHNHQTALVWASVEGHLPVVKRLLAAGADFREPLPSGFTPIHFAAREGHRDLVLFFLDQGVEVDIPLEWKGGNHWRNPLNQSTPLILAMENGYFELAVDLLQRGADPNDDRTGYSALHTMVWVRKPNLGDANSDPPPPIRGAMTSTHFLSELVRHGADVNQRLKHGGKGPGQISGRGATPFFMAAIRADAEMMRILVDNGADPFIPNAFGTTALLAAAGLGRGAENDQAGNQEEAIEAVAYCLELGLDINAVDDHGETAMHGAAYGQWPGMVKFLDENGADIAIWNRRNHWEWSPLLIAQGYRRGNFKPSFPVVAALEAILEREQITLRFDPPAPKMGYSN